MDCRSLVLDIALGDRGNTVPQHIPVKGLTYIRIDPRLIASLNVFRLLAAAKHDDVRLWPQARRPYPSTKVDSVDLGHFPIKHANMKAASLQQRLCLLPILGRDSLMAPIGHGGFHQ